MDDRWIIARLARVETEASGPRLPLLREISAHYERKGVLRPRSATSLCDSCRRADECWAALDEASKLRVSATSYGFKGDAGGSIVWPWIGTEYESGKGVAVVGLNVLDDGSESSVALEYVIAQNNREQFADGRRRNDYGSPYAYRAMSTAKAVLDSIDGAPLQVDPRPESLVSVMDQVARLQLVKCSPNANVVRLGKPSDAMCEICPDEFLFQELETLRPAVVTLFGAPAHRAFNKRARVRWRSQRDDFSRGTLTLGDREVELLWLWHPSSSKWSSSQRSLVASLRRRGITRSDETR